MRYWRALVFVLGLLLVALVGDGRFAAAQGQGEDACPSFVETALQVLDSSCTDLGRDEACYGYNRVEATFRESGGDLVFAAPADRVPLADLQSVLTAPLNLDEDEWGLALLNTRASLPETLPGQGVLFLLMGDAALQDESQPDAAPMQTFYFTTGLDEPGCAEAPNALLVQNPTGSDVTLNINGLEITVGSTVVVTGAEGDIENLPTAREPMMLFSLLGGHLAANVNGQEIDLLRSAPQNGETAPIPAFAITLNDQGRVDENSRVVQPPADHREPTIQQTCRNAASLPQFQPGLQRDFSTTLAGPISRLCDNPVRWFSPRLSSTAHVVPPPRTAHPETTGDVLDYNLNHPATSAGWQQADMDRWPDIWFGSQPISPYGSLPWSQEAPWTFWCGDLDFDFFGPPEGSGTAENPILPGSMFRSGGFVGQGQAFFSYGPFGSGAFVGVDSYYWRVDQVGEGTGETVWTFSGQDNVRWMAQDRAPGSQQSAIAPNLGPDFRLPPQRIAVRRLPFEFRLNGVSSAFTFDAETQTATFYLIEGELRRGDDSEADVFTGPNDGLTALQVQFAPDGSFTETPLLLALVEAEMPAQLRPSALDALTVNISMAEPIAFDGSANQVWYLMFDLDGSPTTGFDGTGQNAMYTGLGVELLITVWVRDGDTLGTEVVFGDQLAGNGVAPEEPVPVSVTVGDDGRVLEVQVSLPDIVPILEARNLAFAPEAVTWRVASVNYATDEAPKDVYPEVDGGPSAGAPAAPNGSSVSLSVSTSGDSRTAQFEDRSSSGDPEIPITGRLWDFGDGATSTEQNPSHVYTYGGDYTITLTITFANDATLSTDLPLHVDGPPAPAEGAQPAPAGDSCPATASGNANLRGGPGTGFEVVGSVAAGEQLQVIGQNAAGDWYQLQLDDGSQAWIATFLASAPVCPSGFTLPVVVAQ